MNESEKRTPESLVGSEQLTTALTAAASNEIDQDLSISLRVFGGLPGRHYRLNFRTRGRELDDASLDCEMTDRHSAVAHVEIDDAIMSTLSRRLLATGVLDTISESPTFLPDTLVGILTIELGDTVRRIYFAADPDQAAVQGKTPPKAVIDAAEALYAAAGRVLDIGDVRP